MGPDVLPPSQKNGQVICSRFIASRILGFGSLLMPRSVKGDFSIRFTSDRSCGYMALQGGHQSPKKSSTTILPRKSVSLIAFPLTSLPLISGASCPTLVPVGGAAEGASLGPVVGPAS